MADVALLRDKEIERRPVPVFRLRESHGGLNDQRLVTGRDGLIIGMLWS